MLNVFDTNGYIINFNYVFANIQKYNNKEITVSRINELMNDFSNNDEYKIIIMENFIIENIFLSYVNKKFSHSKFNDAILGYKNDLRTSIEQSLKLNEASQKMQNQLSNMYDPNFDLKMELINKEYKNVKLEQSIYKAIYTEFKKIESNNLFFKTIAKAKSKKNISEIINLIVHNLVDKSVNDSLEHKIKDLPFHTFKQPKYSRDFNGKLKVIELELFNRVGEKFNISLLNSILDLHNEKKKQIEDVKKRNISIVSDLNIDLRKLNTYIKEGKVQKSGESYKMDVIDIFNSQEVLVKLQNNLVDLNTFNQIVLTQFDNKKLFKDYTELKNLLINDRNHYSLSITEILKTFSNVLNTLDKEVIKDCLNNIKKQVESKTQTQVKDGTKKTVAEDSVSDKFSFQSFYA